MAFEVSKVDVWVADIVDEAGALDRLLAALADAGANLECVIGRREKARPGTGQVFVSPIKGKKVQNAARAAGLSPADMATLRVAGANKPGTGHAIMSAIAAAGVNVRGISVVSLGNQSVAYIGLDSKADADKAIKAIRGADKAGRRKERSTRF